MNLLTTLRSFARRDEGQDLLEYALLVSLIALVAVLAITTAGENVNTIFRADRHCAVTRGAGIGARGRSLQLRDETKGARS